MPLERLFQLNQIQPFKLLYEGRSGGWYINWLCIKEASLLLIMSQMIKSALSLKKSLGYFQWEICINYCPLEDNVTIKGCNKLIFNTQLNFSLEAGEEKK